MSLEMSRPGTESSRDADREGALDAAAPIQVDRREVGRDLRAAIEARRELGPEYEEQLVEAFVEKLTRQLAVQQKERRVRATPPPHDQRLALAIVSLTLLIPLVAIVLGMAMGLPGLALVCLAVLGINIGFRFL
jgi:hypothetical protein